MWHLSVTQALGTDVEEEQKKFKVSYIGSAGPAWDMWELAKKKEKKVCEMNKMNIIKMFNQNLGRARKEY